jgi:hypothetical protein
MGRVMPHTRSAQRLRRLHLPCDDGTMGEQRSSSTFVVGGVR